MRTDYWVVEGTRTHGPEKGSPVRCVVEAVGLETEEEARLFGAGQLRGMGFAVKDVRVARTSEELK